ncbi:MAG: hypothetical protein QOE27_652 [Solirubrobacteraceae bacterium]|nr:hypothetical protein [Solirubrobacteraceae bacterium]
MAHHTPPHSFPLAPLVVAGALLLAGGAAAGEAAAASAAAARPSQQLAAVRRGAKRDLARAKRQVRAKAQAARRAKAKAKAKARRRARRPVVPVSVSPPPPVPAAAGGDCADGGLAPASANLDRVRAATLCLINQRRAAAGVAPLRANSALELAAGRHSSGMVAGDFFGHVDPSGLDVTARLLAAGYPARGDLLAVGEDIAAATGAAATPAAVVADWMSSPGHRANILDPAFTDTGIGLVASVPALLASGVAGATYTECFAAAG